MSNKIIINQIDFSEIDRLNNIIEIKNLRKLNKCIYKLETGGIHNA